jgi:hypothetical protein
LRQFNSLEGMLVMGTLLSLFAKYAARASLFVFASLLAATPALLTIWSIAGRARNWVPKAVRPFCRPARLRQIGCRGVRRWLHIAEGREVGPVSERRNRALAVSAIQPGWWSAQWTLEDAGEGYVRIKNRWKGTYLHNESKSLAAGAMQPGWWSAQWKRERYFPETYRSPTAGRATKVRTFDQYAWLTAHNAFLNYTMRAGLFKPVARNHRATDEQWRPWLAA